MSTLSALTLNIRTLYHYQPYRPEWLEQTLMGNRLHFSNPQSFNDPWDFKPNFNSEILNDPTIRERHILWYDKASRKIDAALPEEEHLRQIKRLRDDKSYLVSTISETTASMARTAADRYRVYCVSTKPDNTLMWSHYAGGHTGVCLEFDCRNTIFGRAIKVEYLCQYPVFDLTNDEDETIMQPWLTKSDVWSYEDEFRVIAQEKATHPFPDVLVTNNSILKLPPGILRSVILGCSIAPEAATHIQGLARRHIAPPILVKKMVRRPDRYDLSMQPAV